MEKHSTLQKGTEETGHPKGVGRKAARHRRRTEESSTTPKKEGRKLHLPQGGNTTQRGLRPPSFGLVLRSHLLFLMCGTAFLLFLGGGSSPSLSFWVVPRLPFLLALFGWFVIVFQSSRGARRLHDAPTALALLSLLSSSARSYLDTYQQGMLRCRGC